MPRGVWVAALLAGIVHMAPYWRAALETPDGWTYTANLSASPDYMQYRVWSRQTQEEGILVSNRFTTEPNGRHLPVVLYWGIGKLSAVTGLTPEWTYAWLGGVLAMSFAVLLYVVVRHFAPHRRASVWIFGTLLVGGGLGGYFRYMQESDWIRGNYLLSKLLLEPLGGPGGAVVFEHFRGNYIVQALFDTHFLVFWLVSTAAVSSLYLTVRRLSAVRLAATASLFAFGTFVHVYEGLTLLFIAAGALFFCWRKGLPGRQALLTGAVCAAAVGVCLVALAAIYRIYGTGAPSWRGPGLVMSVILLSYPLSAALIAWGGVRYWNEAEIDGAFLVGWAVGCLTLIAAAPFFPYPDRGTMTLQIPLFLIAGSIFFANRTRVGLVGAAVVALLIGSTPVRTLDSLVERTRFKAHETHKWMTAGHVEMISTLRDRAASDDVLLAGEVPLRWLAPDYPGRHYAGHFFLTVRYDEKQERLRDFYQSQDPMHRSEFLRDNGIRFVYVDSADVPQTFAAVPGLRPVDSQPFGTLYEFRAVERSMPADGAAMDDRR